MGDSAPVACKVCGFETTIPAYVTHSPGMIERMLPIGWAVREEEDERTELQIVAVYCPNHRPNDNR